jgi:hypothetical protein
MGGNIWGSSYMGQGTWTFESDGTGAASIRMYCITPPPGNPSEAEPVTATAPPNSPKFEYRFESDGTIAVGIPNLSAPFLLLAGRISMDHKTMTLGSAHQVQQTGTSLWQICSIGRVLIRVNE